MSEIDGSSSLRSRRNSSQRTSVSVVSACLFRVSSFLVEDADDEDEDDNLPAKIASCDDGSVLVNACPLFCLLSRVMSDDDFIGLEADRGENTDSASVMYVSWSRQSRLKALLLRSMLLLDELRSSSERPRSDREESRSERLEAKMKFCVDEQCTQPGRHMQCVK